MRGRAVAAQADAEQPRRGRGSGSESAKSRLCGRFPGIPARTMLGRAKFGWLNTLKNCASNRNLTCSVKGNRLGKVKVTPDEFGAAQGVAAEVSELAIFRAVPAARMRRCWGPRQRQRHWDSATEWCRAASRPEWIVLIQRHTRNLAGELRSTALAQCHFHSRSTACSTPRTESRYARMRSGNLPSVQRVPQSRWFRTLIGSCIHVLSVEIVPDVVIARAIVASQISRAAAKNRSGGKLEESAIGNRVHAAAPGVIDLPLQTVAEALLRGHLQVHGSGCWRRWKIGSPPQTWDRWAARKGTAQSSPGTRFDNR